MENQEAQSTTSAPVNEQAPVQVETPTQEPVKTEPVKEEAPPPPAPEPEKPLELKMPEGSRLEASAIEDVLKIAKEKGWSQEFAQSYLEAQSNAVSGYEQKQTEALAQLNDVTWKQELMADKEIGGQNFEESGLLASKAILKFGGQEFHDFLVSQKLNHHPGLFKFAVNVAKAMSDDKLVLPGAQSTDANLPLEQRLYPNMYKE